MKLSEAIRIGCKESYPIKNTMRIQNSHDGKLYACALGAALLVDEETLDHLPIGSAVEGWVMSLNDNGWAKGCSATRLPDAYIDGALHKDSLTGVMLRYNLQAIKIPFQHDYRLAIADVLEQYGY